MNTRETIMCYDDAIAISKEYQYLVGMPFCGEYRTLGQVDAVVIAPSGKLNKSIFLKQFAVHQNAEQALAFYNDNAYDVVLLGRDALGQLTCRELSAHLAFVSSRPDLMMQLD
ncbi:MAG TPA: hypothetical protein VGD89_14915 [Flavipsychrobacter sp.]